jgi:hypothetical protein
MLTKLWWLMLAFGVMTSPLLNASPICTDWPKIRDQSLLVDFDRIRDRYTLAIDQQELWVDQLDDFEENYSIAKVKGVAIADFLTVGLSVTAETLKAIMNLSGLPTGTSGYVNTAEVITDVATSNSVEEASYRMVANKSGVLAKTLSSYSIIKTLLDGKERFKDHKETIELLKRTSKKLRANVDNSRRGVTKTTRQLTDLNDYKNQMDGICNKASSKVTQWVFVGYTIADYVGPPKSYNKVPTQYGSLWIKKDKHYSKNKDDQKKRLKSTYPNSYRNITIASPSSYNFIALYKIDSAIPTWNGVDLYIDKYKFYRGKTEAAIEKQVAKDTAEYKYRATQQLELINLQVKQTELDGQSNSIYERITPNP